MIVLAAFKALEFFLGSGWARLLGAAGFLVLAGGLLADERALLSRSIEPRQVAWRRILIGAIGSALLLGDLVLRNNQQDVI